MTQQNDQFVRAFNLGREWGDIARVAGRLNNLGQNFWTSLVTEPQLLARNSARIRRLNEQFNHFGSVFKNIPPLPDFTALYEKRKEAALLLATRGWFIPPDMTLGEIKELFRE